MEENKKKLLKSSEVAQLLNISMATLKKYFKEGLICAIVINGRRYYTEEAINDFINNGKTINNKNNG